MPYKDAAIETGTAVLQSIQSRLLRESKFAFLSFVTGEGVVKWVRVALPFMNSTTAKVAKLAAQGDIQTLAKDFRSSQQRYLREVTHNLNRDPKEVVVLHADHYLRRGTVHAATGILKNISSFAGDLVCVAALPIIAPSPITSFTLYTAGKLAVGWAATRLLRDPNEDPDLVELDDFRKNDWEELEGADVEDDWEHVEENPLKPA